MNQAKKNTHDRFIQRFNTLVKEGGRLSVQSLESVSFPNPHEDDRFSQDIAQWGVSSSVLLEQVFGQGNLYSKEFQEVLSINNRLGTLRGAHNDYKSGHLFNLRDQVVAEVSEDLLEQGEHFLETWDENMGRALAAFLASCTLETGLRELCQRRQIEPGETTSIGKMLGKLREPLRLNKLEISKLDDCKNLRDPNAHGKWEEFSSEDVRRMIKDVRDFLAKYLK